MSAGIISINYDTALFEIHTGKWRLNCEDCFELPLKKDADVPVLTVDIAGYPMDLCIDSGDDGAIAVTSSFFDSLVRDGIIESAQVPMRIETAGSRLTVRRGWFKSGRLMGKSLTGVEVRESPRRGQIGLQWLVGFNIEIDFENDKFDTRNEKIRRRRRPFS